MEENIIQSLDRALQILDLFSIKQPEWGISEISRNLGFYKSNIYNIIKTLENRGYLRKNDQTEKYQLGEKIIQLASILFGTMDIRTISLPYMRELNNKYNETIHLTAVMGEKAIGLDAIESTMSLRSTFVMGGSVPIHCTATGKVILSSWDDKKIELYVKKNGLQKFTENTITEFDLLIKELKKIREQGYAIDNCEHEEGIKCVAAPIRNNRGQVIASMSVSGPTVRIDKLDLNAIIKDVKENCEKISKLYFGFAG